MSTRNNYSCYDIEDIAGDAIIIPAIKSFELENLGVITKASLHFTQRVTFIVRELPALGETTLIKAMAAAAGADLPLRLLGREDSASLRISAVWKCEPVEIRIPPVEPFNSSNLSMGQRTSAALTHLLTRACSGQCMILGSDCFSCLDKRHRENAFQLLSESSSQVIAFIHHSLQEEIPSSLRQEPTYKIVQDPSDNRRSCLARVEL